MAKKQARPAAPPSPPQIFEARRSANGAVVKTQAIDQAKAVVLRKAGLDVVVCGPDIAENRRLAALIERNANGSAKRCPPHGNEGPHALPHFQPDPRPPEGHTFYETPNRQAF
jgi:hypothetical protein